MLNRGGPANPDVLVLARGGAPPVVVKDYARRSRLARLVGPALVRHELAMLERLEGIAGVPRPLGRLGRFALAMELVDGAPLRRHGLPAGLGAAFFDALDGIVAAIASRGVVHLDLRSPSNVLHTRSGAPAIVDLASAFRLPVPTSLARRFHARAVRKLRGRFEGADDGPDPAPPPLATRDFSVGRVRFRLADAGSLDDAVPALLLHDVGHACVAWSEVVARADAAGRRVLAPDLPPFGASSRVRRGLSPDAQAARVARMLDALRVARVDVVGHGFGGLVARALATRAPGRVRGIVTLDTPIAALAGAWLARWQSAHAGGVGLVDLLEAGLPSALAGAAFESLRGFLRAAPLLAIVRSLCALDVEPSSFALRTPPLPAKPWLALVAQPLGERELAAIERQAPEARPRIELCERPDAWLGAAEGARLFEELASLNG